MCGIGGILRVWPTEQRELALRTPHDQSIPEHWLNVIDDAIKHRGPDGQGRFRDRTIRADGCVVDVALVHRRLSIIDHAGGHQPMVLRIPRTERAASASSGTSISPPPEAKNTPGRLLTPEDLTAHNRRLLAEGHDAIASQDHDHIAVVFNGCIYNHRELRAELQRAGHVFHTDHSDTEVLVHGWREWGEEIFERMDGMWAWVIWESNTGRLYFSRDAAGEKPLFVSPSQDPTVGVVALASTAAGLIGLRTHMGERIDTPRIYDLLMWGYELPAAGETIQPVGPCCISVFDEGSGLFHQDYLYASNQFARKLSRPELPDLEPVDAIEELLSLSVTSRLQSDVGAGCLLSGGIDSALVATLAKQSVGQIRTFTLRMPDAQFDESAAAQRIATAIGSDHSVVECRSDPTEDLLRLITQVGAPLGDSSLLPTHWVSRAVRENGLQVALTGDGGDELFAGYERYRAAVWLKQVGSELASLPALGEGRHPKSLRNRLSRLIRAAKSDGYPDLLRIFSTDDIRRLTGLTDDKLWESTLATLKVFGWSDQRDPRWYDFENYLPFDLCAKVDTASMSVALETRAPMLSRDLVAFAFARSMNAMTPNGQRKGLLRQVARKYLPAEIVDRPKMGFAIPIGEWFRTDYGGLRTMLLDHLNSSEPFGPPSLGIDLNRKFIQQMLDEHLGTGMSGRVTRDHSQRLYMLLVLSIWAKWYDSLSK